MRTKLNRTDKYCKKCDTTKPVSEFHKCKSRYDGYVWYCKPCMNSRILTRRTPRKKYPAKASLIRRALPDYSNDYDPSLKKTCNACLIEKPLTEFNKNKSGPLGTRSNCKSCRYPVLKTWQERDEVKKRKQASYRKWLSNNQEKKDAHIKVHKALLAGVILKNPCIVCGENKKVHGHHTDYSKPLQVHWLCPRHHSAMHSGELQLSSYVNNL